MLTLLKRCMLGFCRIYQHMIATFWAIGPSPDLGADAGLPVGIRVRALGVFTRRDFWVQVSSPETPVKLGQCPGFCMYLLPGNRSCETSLSEVTARGGSGLDPEYPCPSISIPSSSWHTTPHPTLIGLHHGRRNNSSKSLREQASRSRPRTMPPTSAKSPSLLQIIPRDTLLDLESLVPNSKPTTLN